MSILHYIEVHNVLKWGDFCTSNNSV